MNAPKLVGDNQVAAAYELLSSGREHSTREVAVHTGSYAPSTVLAALRERLEQEGHGKTVLSRQDGRLWFYRIGHDATLRPGSSHDH